MKNLNSIILTGTLIAGLTGCIKQPDAAFTTVTTNVSTGESVKFTNTSMDAESYEWNFGDGSTSTEESPSHTYTDAGTYNVTLKALSKKEKKSDDASVSITVTQPNEFQYDNSRHAFAKGYLRYYGDFGGFLPYGVFDVSLFDSGLNYVNDTTMAGVGNGVVLVFVSSSKTALAPGTYNYAQVTGMPSPLTIFLGIGAVNYNAATETGLTPEVVAGKAVVSLSGDTYTIDGNFTMDDGKTMKVFYKGTLVYKDLSYLQGDIGISAKTSSKKDLRSTVSRFVLKP